MGPKAMAGGVTRPLEERIDRLDWDAILAQLHERGHAVTPAVLAAAECRQVIADFDDDTLYRSVIDMRRHRFGSGIYKYFTRPLPPLVDGLRHILYGPLVAV